MSPNRNVGNSARQRHACPSLVRRRVIPLDLHHYISLSLSLSLSTLAQMIEVEASHRVEKQAKALQSELTFKDHQLAEARKASSSAARELNAERAKRKRDSLQAARDREAAVAKAAAAAAATAAAGAVEAAAAEAAAAAAAAATAAAKASPPDSARREEGGGHGAARLQQPDSVRRGARAAAETLAEVILSESSEDVMVLLGAGGSTAASRHYSAADDWGDEDSGSGSDGDGGHTGYWDQSPRHTSRRPRLDSDGGGGGVEEDCEGPGGPYSPSPPGAAPDSASPVRLAPWEHRLRADETPTMARGASSRSELVRAGAAAAVATGDGIFTGKYPDADYVDGAVSPQRFWGADGEEGEGEDLDGSDADGDGGGDAAIADEALEELRDLSSQMFSCAVGLLEGEACAGDLLDVLVGFLDELAGDTVSQGRRRGCCRVALVGNRVGGTLTGLGGCCT